MAVAVPVARADGAVVAALGVGGPRVRLDPERLAAIAKLLPASAARISERLGVAAEVARARPRQAPYRSEPHRQQGGHDDDTKKIVILGGGMIGSAMAMDLQREGRQPT